PKVAILRVRPCAVSDSFYETFYSPYKVYQTRIELLKTVIPVLITQERLKL
ncbi:hypothetical protein HMPREF9554_02007, partial [Treponema phagedenis F0421]